MLNSPNPTVFANIDDLQDRERVVFNTEADAWPHLGDKFTRDDFYGATPSCQKRKLN